MRFPGHRGAIVFGPQDAVGHTILGIQSISFAIEADKIDVTEMESTGLPLRKWANAMCAFTGDFTANYMSQQNVMDADDATEPVLTPITEQMLTADDCSAPTNFNFAGQATLYLYPADPNCDANNVEISGYMSIKGFKLSESVDGLATYDCSFRFRDTPEFRLQGVSVYDNPTFVVAD